MDEELNELRARYERVKLLYEVSRVIHSTLDPHQALQLIIDEAVRLMRASSGSVVLVNPTTGFLDIEAGHGLPAAALQLKLRVGEGVTGWVARFGQPACVGDVRQDPRYIMVRAHARSELAVPLEVNGEVRGVLNVDSDRVQAFSPSDQELLEELADGAAKVIQNTWLYEQLRLKARLFESLVSVGQTINSTFRMEEALHVITREACQLMGAKMCSLLMLDDSRSWLDLRASHGAGPSYISKPRLSVDDSLLGVVVRRKKPLQVENVQISSRYQSVEVARKEGLVALLSVPLIYGGKAIGALNVYTAQPHSFSNEEIHLLGALAELSALAIEKARLYERIVDIEEQLRQNEKLSALGLLAAEVAHEIRNPLTVIKMLFHSLDLKFPASDPRSRDVQIMASKMEQLNRIVEQILDFARRNEPAPAPVNLNTVVDDLSLLIRHKLTLHSVRLECSLDPNLPLVLADAAQLEQVFLNLALNALEAMPAGGELAIVTRCQRPTARGSAPQVIIEFQDTGKGMTAEQQKRVFVSVLKSTKGKGTGLGLAVVARIVEAHHGKIRVRSRFGRGTTFSIRFPVEGLETPAKGG